MGGSLSTAGGAGTNLHPQGWVPASGWSDLSPIAPENEPYMCGCKSAAAPGGCNDLQWLRAMAEPAYLSAGWGTSGTIGTAGGAEGGAGGGGGCGSDTPGTTMMAGGGGVGGRGGGDSGGGCGGRGGGGEGERGLMRGGGGGGL